MTALTKEQAAEVRKIAHEVIQMHIDHDAPDGHKGFDKLLPILKGKSERIRSWVADALGKGK